MTFDFSALDMLGKALLPRRWIFAKTMPENPHWYTLRRDWNDDALFDEVVQVQRRIGYTEYYHRRPYTMVNMNGMKYWTMGAPIEKTILINRKIICPPSPYDAIAGRFDSLFADTESLQENEEVIHLLAYQGESVLDIGCGSGLFLDHIQPSTYVGIDPSHKMLETLAAKHPMASVIQTPFEEYVGLKADLAISLFGTASYIHPEAIRRIPDMVSASGRWFVMFYKDDYVPVTYDRAGIPAIDYYRGNHLLLPGMAMELNSFWIVQGQHGKDILEEKRF